MTIIKTIYVMFLGIALLISPWRLALFAAAAPSSANIHYFRSASSPPGLIATDGINVFTPSGKHYYGPSSDGEHTWAISPNWCKSDNRFYYLQTDQDWHWRLRAMHPDGTGSLTILPVCKNNYETTISPSPDGRRIAFSRFYGYSGSPLFQYLTAISIEDIKTRKVHNLTSHHCNNDQPIWSPDGNKIAFQSYRSGIARVWIMNRDGSHKHLVPNQPFGYSDYPAWSPDGRSIALLWSYEVSTSQEDLYTINLLTGRRQLVTRNLERVRVAWSPDGRYIAFGREHNPLGYHHQHGHYLFIINLHTGCITKVWALPVQGDCIAWAPASKN